MRLRIVTIVLMIAVIVGGVFVGTDLFRGGSGGGWSHESGDAWGAERVFQVFFDRGRPNFVAVVTASEGDVDTAAVAEAAADLEAQLSELAVFETESYWSLGRPEFLKNEDGSAAMVLGRVPGATESLADRARVIDERLRWDRDVISVSLGGAVMTHLDIRDGSTDALPMVAVGGLLALLLAALSIRTIRGTMIVAAGMAMAVSATLLALTGLDTIVELPALSKVLAVAVALGLTVANSYLMIVRFLEERRVGAGRQAAVVATVTTAGRVAAVASVVAIAIGFTLVALPTALLRSTGYAVALTALASGLASVVVVGLFLSMFGAGPVVRDAGGGGAVWVNRLFALLQPRSMLTLVVVAALLLPLAFMGIGVRTVEPGPETLPSDAVSRRTAQFISAEFSANDAEAVFVLPGSLPVTRRSEELTQQYVEAVSNIPGVARVDHAGGTVVEGRQIRVPEGYSERYVSEQANYMHVPLIGNAHSAAAEAAVTAIGDLSAPFRTNIGGVTARQIETVSAVSGRALFAFAVALAFALVLIAGLLKSIRAGLRATLMAALLGAVTGAVIRVGFADGALAGPLGFAANGAVAVGAGPIAWALSGIVASTVVIVGWGSVREAIDAAGNNLTRVRMRLVDTAGSHVVAVSCLALPLAGLLFAGWRTAQLPGVAAVTTAVVAATVGRFVLLPAFVAFRPAALWPVQADGEVHRVFAPTVASRQWPVAPVAPMRRPETLEPATAIVDEPEEIVAITAPDPVAADDAMPDVESEELSTPSPERAPGTEVIDAARDEPAPDADTDELEPVFAQLREETETSDEVAPGDDAPAVDEVVEPSVEMELPTKPAELEVVAAEPQSAQRGDDEIVDVELVDEDVATDVLEPAHPPEQVGDLAADESAQLVDVTHIEDVDEPVALEPVDVHESGGVGVSGDGDAPVVAAESGEVHEPAEVVAPEDVEILEPRDLAGTADVAEPAEDVKPIRTQDPVDVDAPTDISSLAADEVEIVDGPEPADGAEQVEGDERRAGEVLEPVEMFEPTDVVEPGDEAEGAADADSELVAAGDGDAGASTADDGDVVTELHVAGDAVEDGRREPFALDEEERLPTVDVVSLTQSVIASLEAERAFTTEIGSGHVANPSNNLSRVMEAILRDASSRGGEEVLVYGHASKGRYRWMVVDSGPHAESDPDRARTLAEAQRFIRRVGGVVECRPEGDFTVFVVEIPMAS